MKEKPILKLYEYKDSQFIQIAQIDDYQQISFEHNLYKAGTFTITINYNIPNAKLFKKGLFIQFGNNKFDFGVIEKITNSIGSNGKGSELINIIGYDARYLFKRRIIKNLNSNDKWAMTDKAEMCIRSLVYSEAGAGAETARQLPIANAIPTSENAIGKEYSVSESYTNLYDVLCTIATQGEIGWAVTFENNELSLEVYAGENKSSSVFFSTDYESLSKGEFTDSNESFANSVYIGGKGTGSERDLFEGSIDDGSGNEPSSLDRFEAFDNQSSMTTEEEYETEANSMLTQYGQTITVSGAGMVKCPFVFREEYDIGDIIRMKFSDKTADVQILSVTEQWSWNTYSLSFSFGKPQNTLGDQLNLILKKIEIASNKTNAIESVKWYTIPTDTEQTKADVTFNTLGFTGAIGNSNRTFTLHFDNTSKTGSKSYTVYAKNLTGSGKLILTTGVSGASDLELPSGNNVASVYVDENGNIISTEFSMVTDVSNLNSSVDDINDKIPSNASTSNQLATQSDVVTQETLLNPNLNTLLDFKCYRVYTDNSSAYNDGHFPVENYGTVFNAKPAVGENMMQIFYPDYSNNIYTRLYKDGEWTNWTKIINENDISVGGLTTIINNSDAYITARRAGHIVILCAWIKKAVSFTVNLPYTAYRDQDGLKGGLFWYGACYGEIYAESATSIVVNATSQCSGEFVFFVE
jgi:hypothetical protein